MQAEQLRRGSGFYNLIKKLKLSTFADMKKRHCGERNKQKIVLKADNRAFGHMLLIAHNRKLDMGEVRVTPLVKIYGH